MQELLRILCVCCSNYFSCEWLHLNHTAWINHFIETECPTTATATKVHTHPVNPSEIAGMSKPDALLWRTCRVFLSSEACLTRVLLVDWPSHSYRPRYNVAMTIKWFVLIVCVKGHNHSSLQCLVKVFISFHINLWMCFDLKILIVALVLRLGSLFCWPDPVSSV